MLSPIAGVFYEHNALVATPSTHDELRRAQKQSSIYVPRVSDNIYDFHCGFAITKCEAPLGLNVKLST